MRERIRWTFAALVALLFVILAFTMAVTTPVVADPDDEPATGLWAEDGSVFRDTVRLSSDDPSADPVDWYRVNLTAGSSSLDLLRIDVNLTRNGGEQFLVWASIHDPDGALLTEVRSTNYVVKSTSTLCHRSGVYLVRVYTYSYFECHYRLVFNIEGRPNVTDGDDTLGEATYLEPPVDVTGHLHGILDPFDHYAVNLTRDATHYEFVQVSLGLFGTPVGRTDLDLFLIVFDDGGVPHQVAASTSNGSYEMAFFASTLEDTTVYIRCHAYGGNTSYALNVTKVKVTDDGNNNILRAEELDAISSTEDSLNLTDRLDYYKINLTGGDLLWVEVLSHDWNPAVRKPDLNLYLYSWNGLIINWSHSYDPLERASVRAPEGDPAAFYYVLVTFFDRNPVDGIPAWGDYTINITVDRAPRLIGELPLVIEEDSFFEVPLSSLVEDPDDELGQVRAEPGDDINAMVSGGMVRIVPPINFSGLTEFTLVVMEPHREVELTVPVNVTPVPDAPGLPADLSPIQVDEDGRVTVDILDIIVDADGDPFVVMALWDGNHSLGASTLVGTTLTIVPGTDLFGNFTLPIEVEDVTGLVAIIDVPIEVLPLPDAPLVLLEDVELTVNEDDRGIEFDLSTMFFDPDGGGLSYHITEGTGNALFIIIDDTLVIDTKSDYHGSVTLTIEATAGEQWVTSSLLLVIRSVVDPPTVTSADPNGDVSMTEGETRILMVMAEDVEGGALTYSWFLDGVQIPGEELPRMELVTNFSYSRSVLVTVRISNGAKDSFWNWSVQVENVNQPPSLVLRRPKDGATFEEGSNVVFEAEADDPDGEALSVRWIENGKVIGTGLAFTTSDLGPGSHIITAQVVDPHGSTTEANVRITVDDASGLPGACGPATVIAILLGGMLAAVWHRTQKQ